MRPKCELRDVVEGFHSFAIEEWNIMVPPSSSVIFFADDMLNVMLLTHLTEAKRGEKASS